MTRMEDALAAVDDWPVDHVAVGVVEREGQMVVRGESGRVFPLASVTKLLVAYAALVALEEGTIALDEPAGPDGSTVAHLLAHASGLPFEGGEPMATPGARRIYSNTGFDVLGDHLAAAAGMPVARYVAEAVIEPLAMPATALDGSPAKDAVGPVEDLVLFAAELLAPTLVSAETLAGATEVAFPGLAGTLPGFGRQDPNDWGLGFELRDGKHPHWTGAQNSPRTFGHFGGSGTFLWVDPEARCAAVCLTDRPFGDWATRRWPELSDAILGQKR